VRTTIIGLLVMSFVTLGAMAQPPDVQKSVADLAAPDDALQKWIAANAIAIRSIDPKDEDFIDLEPLMQAIGSARVVQLGEPSHGAGSAFAAKARLIKFLHQRMGFDIVAWESGFFEVRLTQAAFRGSDDPVLAAQRGILTVWSNAAEAKPLFEYVKASQNTTRPIEMVGLDMNVSAPGVDERLAADLSSFVAALRDPVKRRELAMLVDRIASAQERLRAYAVAGERKWIEATRAGLAGKELDETLKLWEQAEGRKLRPTAAEFAEFLAATDGLMSAMRSGRASFEQVHGAGEVAFMERVMENLRGRSTTQYENDRPDSAPNNIRNSASWNLRDGLMADNLRWLMQQVFSGRKAIVWAHNAHIMNAYFAQDWSGVYTKPQPGGMKPAGASATEWLNGSVYTVAVTTYEGEEAWANGQRRAPISPAPEGSMESRLHRLGRPQVFLDLRSVRAENQHPMRTTNSLRISGYGKPTSEYGNDRVPDLTQAFDAIFYIDRMAPATALCKGRCTASAPSTKRE
jgi:erythromycin esterase